MSNADDMIEAPFGYDFATVAGRNLQHLVASMAYNSVALCDVRIFTPSLSSVRHNNSHLCEACNAEYQRQTQA